MRDEDVSLEGTSLDRERYSLGPRLGRGGMGSVHRAVDTATGRTCAVKVLHPALAREHRHLVRFEREARIATHLAHPHIVSVLDVGYDQHLRVPYFAMELLDGVPLSDLLRSEGALSVDRAVAIARQILAALSAVHSVGVVHRDLKPQNVMLVEDERVKLVDFGVAHLVETDGYTKLTRTGQIVGTPAYMAPEQAAGRPIDPRADLWAAGALLYACLAGSWPFAGRSWVEVVPRLLAGDIPRLESRVRGIEPIARVVHRALSVEPEARFDTAAAMDEALASAVTSATRRPPPATLGWVPPSPLDQLRAEARSMETALSKLVPADSGIDPSGAGAFASVAGASSPVVRSAPSHAARPASASAGANAASVREPAPTRRRSGPALLVVIVAGAAALVGAIVVWTWVASPHGATLAPTEPTTPLASTTPEVVVPMQPRAEPLAPTPAPAPAPEPEPDPGDPGPARVHRAGSRGGGSRSTQPSDPGLAHAGEAPDFQNIEIATPSYTWHNAYVRLVDYARDSAGFKRCIQFLPAAHVIPMPWRITVGFDVVDGRPARVHAVGVDPRVQGLDECIARFLLPERVDPAGPDPSATVDYEFRRR